jgi:diguanylate cyclase (GGDEF)-like protein
MPAKIHLLVCQNAEREAQAVFERGGAVFEDVVVVIGPARCGRPPLSVLEVQALVPEAGAVVECVGGVCVAGLSRKLEGYDSYHVHRVGWYEMFADRMALERLLAERAYVMTPSWLRHWRERLATWGFETDPLRAFVHDTVSHLHLLDTGVDPDSGGLLEELGEYLQVPVVTTFVGLDHYARFLERIVIARRCELRDAEQERAIGKLHQKVADYAMAMDLLGRLSEARDERQVVRQLMDVFSRIFAPGALTFVAYEQGQPSVAHSLDGSMGSVADALRGRLDSLEADVLWSDSKEDVLARISHDGQLFGVIVADRIAFPQYSSYYQNLIVSVLPICGMSVANARNYREVLETGEALRKANQELLRLANTDGLTQVANRRHFDQRLALEWRRALRQKVPISLIMIDIDYFKRYNDQWGHQAGDMCLCRVARAIEGCVARAGDLLARYGGEEFVVILPDTPGAGAHHVAECIRQAVASALIVHGASPVGPHVTVSVGHATMVPNQRARVEQLISTADQGLYSAKSQGRNQSCQLACSPETPSCA